MQLRHIQIFILLVFIFNSCSGQDYTIETKHFDCLVTTSDEFGVNLKKELSDFEAHLIRTKVLADNTGNSYYKIFEIIKETGDINFEFQYSLLDSMKSNFDNIEFSNVNVDCLKFAEKTKKTRKLKRSKLFQLKVGMDSIRNIGNLNVSEVADVILRVLNPKDFEYDYYKMTALLMLATTQDSDSGVIGGISKISNDGEKAIDKRNLLPVIITAENDSVTLNDTKVSINELSEIVVNYIISDSNDITMPELIPIHIDLIGECFQSKLIISMQNDRGTSYNIYIKVQDKLTGAYKKVRNDKAIEYFDVEFDKLTTEQKEAIKELIPMRISDAEPTQ